MKRQIGELRKIAVLWNSPYLTTMIDGLFQYASHHRDWLVQVGRMPPREAGTKAFAALVGSFDDATEYRAFLALGIPMLAIFRRPERSRIPCIMVDHEAVGRMAGRYFLERKLRHFAFIGFCRGETPDAAVAAQPLDPVESGRYRGLAAVVRQRAESVSLLPDFNLWSPKGGARMARWLHALPKPCGVLCVSDVIGQLVTVICRAEGLLVPDQLAILGVDNSENLCGLSQPPLSSVAIPWARIGYQAGLLLDRMLAGKPVSSEILRIEPDRIVVRGSTEAEPAGDALTEQALMVLRARAFEPGNIKEIYSDFPVSRRQIERHVYATIGKTLLDELWSLRTQRTARLLESVETEAWSMQRIAQASGFSDARQMNRIYRKVMGRLPSKDRILRNRNSS
ncbi:MAG: substrate-binding domain-containing protein [Kiritimatiellia bacterium]|nr:substrate-binding domain-containing protein [Kiritimatiellia bacterium]